MSRTSSKSIGYVQKNAAVNSSLASAISISILTSVKSFGLWLILRGEVLDFGRELLGVVFWLSIKYFWQRASCSCSSVMSVISMLDCISASMCEMDCWIRGFSKGVISLMISSNNVLDSLVNSADVKNTLDSLVVPSNSPVKARLPPAFSVFFKNRLIIRCSNRWHVSWSAGKS